MLATGRGASLSASETRAVAVMRSRRTAGSSRRPGGDQGGAARVAAGAVGVALFGHPGGAGGEVFGHSVGAEMTAFPPAVSGDRRLGAVVGGLGTG